MAMRGPATIPPTGIEAENIQKEQHIIASVEEHTDLTNSPAGTPLVRDCKIRMVYVVPVTGKTFVRFLNAGAERSATASPMYHLRVTSSKLRGDNNCWKENQ
jgi:hypothetical protein